ncbi:hypothetical protein FACS189454_07550 [Planctomycetales bacterium]|nr:hypothetical protein FACS189454_07550 [Planctomycetales bacterium]
MIRFEISEQELETLSKERFYHPGPIDTDDGALFLRDLIFHWNEVRVTVGESLSHSLFCNTKPEWYILFPATVRVL